MTRFSRYIALAATIVLGACSTNPATGERSFTAFMSPAQEQEVGAEEHPKILEQFGGEYDSPRVKAYADHIGQELARVSDVPNQKFTFTVLNSPIINAFALPGGYVYVTRGLMALAGDEAEFAGVIAHEIGHVAARHTAQRYSRSVAVGIGAALLGAVSGSDAVGQIANLGSELYLKSFSREQEFEADTLGVRYLARAGYDTGAMAGFLTRLHENSKLEAERAGASEDEVDKFDFFATHPRTVDRVDRAVQQANATMVANPRRGRVDYMTNLNGLVYGDSPENGLIRGRSFIHPKLRFRFDVPEGFRLINLPTQVVAKGPGGSLILFDIAKKRFNGTMSAYVRDVWGRQLNLTHLEAIGVNGMDGGTAASRVNRGSEFVDLRLVAIRGGLNTIYRFAFITPPQLTNRLNEGLRRTTFSLRRLTAQEAAAAKPYRLLIRAAKDGDTVAKLAAQMPPIDFKEQVFRVLNGLPDGAEPRPGSLIKLITE
jgi:predicted Zn-dependent protease